MSKKKSTHQLISTANCKHCSSDIDIYVVNGHILSLAAAYKDLPPIAVRLTQTRFVDMGPDVSDSIIADILIPCTSCKMSFNAVISILAFSDSFIPLDTTIVSTMDCLKQSQTSKNLLSFNTSNNSAGHLLITIADQLIEPPVSEASYRLGP